MRICGPFAVVTLCSVMLSGHAPSGDALSGGEGTVFDTSRNAFSLPARNLLDEHRPSFFVGNSFFNLNWVVAPASVAGRDGLGPLFNARSCSACHFKDGRGRPPDANEPMTLMLLRISVPGVDSHGGPKPDPVYGDQLQTQAIPGVAPEADVVVEYTEVTGAFADGEPYALRRPSYRIANLRYGPLASPLLLSGRVAPAMIGLGLLEAVPESALQSLSDPADKDGDGISGHSNIVWNQVTSRMDVGRFGWKAEQPSVLLQSAAAFQGDIGITSTIFPGPQKDAPEVSDKILHAVALYGRCLAVPAARTEDAPEAVRGRQLFASARCTACHVAELKTGDVTDLRELANQVIRPYTDLLLHDLGDDLADKRPAFAADGREWRTAPLWGLGLIAKVNGHTFLLHDGRARNISEAILWHGGEATTSRRQFQRMSKPDRQALLAFLESL